ncbi:MAG TPA: hypothetical protein VE172_16425 [Stackebrandtia sp.]|jgi:hypothetical protein|uniref:hypothetical protein n=1 Tax=Stackebrandtia sp. TaxID=2023065 RepID=UPI002D2C9EA4|nr:hypothetical protein [Stackebrandtia sp.]HZE40389.1 hypothetical protein [Stackebrandtia sp.]
MKTTLEAYQAEVRAIVARGHSEEGWVHMLRDANGNFDVVIDDRYYRAGETETAAEIASALKAVLADHRRQYFAVRRDHFGPDLGLVGEVRS